MVVEKLEGGRSKGSMSWGYVELKRGKAKDPDEVPEGHAALGLTYLLDIRPPDNPLVRGR